MEKKKAMEREARQHIISSVDLGQTHGNFVSEDDFASNASLEFRAAPASSPIPGSQTPFFSVHMERQYEQVIEVLDDESFLWIL